MVEDPVARAFVTVPVLGDGAGRQQETDREQRAEESETESFGCVGG
ncbi:hypothetical protein [Streptomyces sp. NPDC088762]